MNLGLFVARAVVAVPYNHIICQKVINATTSCIVLKKGQFLAKMSLLVESCHLISLQSFVKSNNQCNNVDIDSNVIQSFVSNFDLRKQCAHLSDCQFSDLWKNTLCT